MMPAFSSPGCGTRKHLRPEVGMRKGEIMLIIFFADVGITILKEALLRYYPQQTSFTNLGIHPSGGSTTFGLLFII